MNAKKTILSLVACLVMGGFAQAATVTLSGASQVEDLMLQTGTSPYGYFNEGSLNTLSVGKWEIGGKGNTHTLIRFLGLDAYLGQTVASATLKLYYAKSSSQLYDTTVQLYAEATANAGWVEGNSQWGSAGWGPAPTSCWIFKNYATTSWAGSQGSGTPGTDYVNTVLDSVTLSTAQSGSYINFAVNPAVVQGWINNYAAGVKNPGLFLRDSTEGTAGYQALFSSSEGANSPVLEVTLAPVPEPTAMLLLVSGACLVACRKRK